MRPAAQILARVFERIGWPRAALDLQLRTGFSLEPEMALLPFLADRTRVAIDVGAADGLYARALQKLAGRVIAFEPNPLSRRRLQRAMPELDVRSWALSDAPGGTELRVPVRKGVAMSGWGTIHGGNDLSEAAPQETLRFNVECRRLDDCGITDVGFIKIDVEGHEQAMLDGARQTLMRDRPNLLVEWSGAARGGASASLPQHLEALGYGVFRLDEGRLRRLSADAPPVCNIIAIAP